MSNKYGVFSVLSGHTRCFFSVEESRLQAQMAFSNNDFEYAKTQEVRESFMSRRSSDNEEEEFDRPPPQTKQKIGNDLDKVDIQPGFQI